MDEPDSTPPANPDGRRARKARTREAILEAAGRLLSRQGIERTSVAEVTGEAGRTVGGFYGHWDSKEELFTEALRRAYRASWKNLLARHGTQGATSLDRGVAILRAYLSRSHRDGDDDPGCPIPRVAPEAERLGGELREVFAEETGTFADELAARVGGKRAVALGMIALMYGGVSMARAVKGTPLADEILRACRELGGLALGNAGARLDKK